MRIGTPSMHFADRGLHVVHLGGPGTPLLLVLYGTDDMEIAKLTEERGQCIDPGHVDFFLGPNCRPATYRHHLVEKLPNGTSVVLHDDPQALAADRSAWITFLDKWISRHEAP